MAKPKFSSQRRKKLKFYGNRFTKHNQGHCVDGGNGSDGLGDEFKSPNTSTDDQEPDHQEKETLSASYWKLKEDTEEKKPVDKPDKISPSSEPTITGFRFFDMEVLCNVLSMLGCHQCGELDLLFMEDKINRKGCASKPAFIMQKLWLEIFILYLQTAGKEF